MVFSSHWRSEIHKFHVNSVSAEILPVWYMTDRVQKKKHIGPTKFCQYSAANVLCHGEKDSGATENYSQEPQRIIHRTIWNQMEFAQLDFNIAWDQWLLLFSFFKSECLELLSFAFPTLLCWKQVTCFFSFTAPMWRGTMPQDRPQPKPSPHRI